MFWNAKNGSVRTDDTEMNYVYIWNRKRISGHDYRTWRYCLWGSKCYKSLIVLCVILQSLPYDC